MSIVKRSIIYWGIILSPILIIGMCHSTNAPEPNCCGIERQKEYKILIDYHEGRFMQSRHILNHKIADGCVSWYICCKDSLIWSEPYCKPFLIEANEKRNIN